MAFDAAGDVYVTDTDGKTRSEVIELSPDGRAIARWQRFAQGPGARSGPEGIALTSAGSLLVTDGGTSRILELSPALDRYRVFASDVKFENLGHIALGSGTVYVSEGSPRTILKLTSAGRLVERWHRPKGHAPEEWSLPESIALQPDRNLVVEDWANRRIEILAPSGRTLKIFGRAGRGNGEFLNTAGLNVDSRGDIYVADVALHRLAEFDPHGRFMRAIGGPVFREGPSSVAISPSGVIYTADGTSIVRLAANGKLLSRWN